MTFSLVAGVFTNVVKWESVKRGKENYTAVMLGICFVSEYLFCKLLDLVETDKWTNQLIWGVTLHEMTENGKSLTFSNSIHRWSQTKNGYGNKLMKAIDRQPESSVFLMFHLD